MRNEVDLRTSVAQHDVPPDTEAKNYISCCTSVRLFVKRGRSVVAHRDNGKRYEHSTRLVCRPCSLQSCVASEHPSRAALHGVAGFPRAHR
jgi:hypothetical protein